MSGRKRGWGTIFMSVFGVYGRRRTMKYIKLNQDKLKMNLQMFTGDEADGGNGDGGQSTEPITFASQAEFDSAVDKRTAKALETAQNKWQEQLEQTRQAALTEGQRMAQMTAEEREAEKARQQSEAEAKREADLTRRELRLTALEELETRNLDKRLIEAVALTNAEDCTNSINAIETAFREAVEAGVNERLQRSAEIPGGGGANTNQPESRAKRLAQNNAGQQKESKFFN